MKRDVKQEVRTIERRVAGVEGVVKFTIGVQLKQLSDAEKLRKLVIAHANKVNRFNNHPRAKAAGCKPSEGFLALESFAGGLQPFTKISKQLRAKLTKLTRTK